MRIAHLSDLHLFPPGALKTYRLLNRRIFGLANLMVVRKRAHSTAVCMAAVDEVVRQQVDHTVVTGDLTNLALRGEFQLAEETLKPLGGYENLTVVPGNHDFYTPGVVHDGCFEQWFGYTLWGADETARKWPVVKERNGVILVAVRTATTPPPLCAFGRVGEEQAESLKGILQSARDRGRDAVVLLHHNLHKRGFLAESTGRLLDKVTVSTLLAESGAVLVLHGHDHREHEMIMTGDGGAGPGVRVVGCGSSSSNPAAHSRPGRFNIYTIENGEVRIERWRYQRSEKRFRPVMA